jgi:hypothetical protein
MQVNQQLARYPEIPIVGNLVPSPYAGNEQAGAKAKNGTKADGKSMYSPSGADEPGRKVVQFIQVEDTPTIDTAPKCCNTSMTVAVVNQVHASSMGSRTESQQLPSITESEASEISGAPKNSTQYWEDHANYARVLAQTNRCE